MNWWLCGHSDYLCEGEEWMQESGWGEGGQLREESGGKERTQKSGEWRVGRRRKRRCEGFDKRNGMWGWIREEGKKAYYPDCLLSYFFLSFFLLAFFSFFSSFHTFTTLTPHLHPQLHATPPSSLSYSHTTSHPDEKGCGGGGGGVLPPTQVKIDNRSWGELRLRSGRARCGLQVRSPSMVCALASKFCSYPILANAPQKKKVNFGAFVPFNSIWGNNPALFNCKL